MNLAIIFTIVLIINYSIKFVASFISYITYDSKEVQDTVKTLQGIMPKLNRNSYIQSMFIFGGMLAGSIYLLKFLLSI